MGDRAQAARGTAQLRSTRPLPDGDAYVTTACDYDDDADGALKEAQRWRKIVNDADKTQVRVVQAAIVYAAIAKGDGKLAEATLEEMKDSSWVMLLTLAVIP